MIRKYVLFMLMAFYFYKIFVLGRTPDPPIIDVSAHPTPTGTLQSPENKSYWKELKKKTIGGEIGYKGKSKNMLINAIYVVPKTFST
jgi:hypothetical protein